MIYWKNKVSFLESTKSNLTAIPYMAAIMADYETYGLEHLASELDWGYARKRAEKVKAIREIRKDAPMIVERNKESQYQLTYLLSLFPALEDIIEAEYNQLPEVKVSDLSEKEDIKNVVLVGMSMGGYPSQHFATIYPCMVSGLVAVDTTPLGLQYYSKSDLWWVKQIAPMAQITGKVKSYCRAWAKQTGSVLHWIKNARHFANGDNPEQVNKEIEIFINSLNSKMEKIQ